MPDRKLFEAVNKNINKFEIRLENYIIPSLVSSKLDKNEAQVSLTPKASKEHVTIQELIKGQKPVRSGQELISKAPINLVKEENSAKLQTYSKNEIIERNAVFAEKQVAEQPKLCMWVYMSQQNIECLMNLTSKQKIRETIDNKIKLEYPKGVSRLLVIELMYSVVRFCQKCKFNVTQTGTLLSIFYLIHEYFLSSFYTTAEKVYCFFKEYMLLHCFECPPDSMELFNYKESSHIVRYFCILYLQNLPLIRLLTLPNFGFYLNYEKQPDPLDEMGKKGKDKKKKGKGDKESKM